MGEIVALRDLSPQQRVGGYFAAFEDLENYVRFLSFDCVAAQHCDRGWFVCPVSVIEKSEVRGATTYASDS